MLIVSSTKDNVSVAIADKLKEYISFEDKGLLDGFPYFISENIKMLEINVLHINADFLNKYNDTIMFLSRHSSEKGVSSFTVHPLGNFGSSALFGGKPKMLGMAAPIEMQQMLSIIYKNNTFGIDTVYEATHHGPLLDVPSFFVEIGGNEETMANKKYHELFAKSIIEFIENIKNAPSGRIAVGIGGSHYEKQFAKLAIEGKYAFSHMMPKYQIENLDMLEQAKTRSKPEAEIAVIEKSSFNLEQKDKIYKELNKIGLDYILI